MHILYIKHTLLYAAILKPNVFVKLGITVYTVYTS